MPAPFLLSATAPWRFPKLWGRVGVHEAWREWRPAQDVPSQAKVQAREVRAIGSIVEHGNSVALCDHIWSQRDGFKSAEEHQGEFLVLPGSMNGASWAHSAPKEQLRQGVPQEAYRINPCQF